MRKHCRRKKSYSWNKQCFWICRGRFFASWEANFDSTTKFHSLSSYSSHTYKFEYLEFENCGWTEDYTWKIQAELVFVMQEVVFLSICSCLVIVVIYTGTSRSKLYFTSHSHYLQSSRPRLNYSTFLQLFYNKILQLFHNSLAICLYATNT
jgi:hypothetical protein